MYTVEVAMISIYLTILFLGIAAMGVYLYFYYRKHMKMRDVDVVNTINGANSYHNACLAASSFQNDQIQMKNICHAGRDEEACRCCRCQKYANSDSATVESASSQFYGEKDTNSAYGSMDSTEAIGGKWFREAYPDYK